MTLPLARPDRTGLPWRPACATLVRAALLACALLAWLPPAFAVDYFSRGSGNWTSNGRWSTASCGGASAGGAEPSAAADTATICNGHTVTLNTSTSITSVTVQNGGTLQIGNSGTARTLSLSGDITVDNGATLRASTGSNTTHTINLDGNLTVNGTLQFAPDNNSFVNITFTGTSQTISGTPTANNFNRITIDMAGADFNNIVDVTASVFTLDSGNVSSTEGVTLVDGTFRLSSGVTIVPFDNGPFNGAPEDYLIGSNSRLWLNHASAVINYQTGNNLTLSGGSRIRIDAGTFNFGNALDVRVRLYNDGEFIMNGGAMNIAGRFTCQTALPAGNSFTYTQTGGTLRVATVGNTSGSFPAFCNGTAGTFNMSGGTIIVERGTTSGGGPSFVSLSSGGGSVTGGTIQIGDPAINPTGGVSSDTDQRNVFVLSENPMWNLVVNRSDITMRIDDYNLVVRNSVSITSGTLNTLDENGTTSRDITVGDTSGNGGVGSWTNNGTFTANASTVSFVGPGSGATLGGTAATTFNNLTMNKASNHLTISSASLALAPTVSNTLTLTSGRIITPSCAIPITVGTGGTISGGSSSSYVQTAVRKSYNAADTISFLGGGLDEFPVGDASGNYTPVEISAGTTSTAGSLTVCVTPTEHPNVTNPVGTTGTIDATKSVNRYWTFTNEGLLDVSGTPIDAIFKFVAGDVDGPAATANFIVERWNAGNSTWSPTTVGTRTATSTRASNIVLPVATSEFAIGEPVSGFTQAPGAFNIFDTTTPAGAILGKIQTKVSGTPFTLSIVALNTARNAIDTTWAQAGTAQLFDASNNTGALDANGCRPTWVAIGPTATAVGAGWASGRINVAFAAVTNSYKDVRVKFTDTAPPGTIGCSTDRFAIRPASLTASGRDATWETAGTARALNNTGATGGNVHKASTAAAPTPRPFTLRATPVPGTATNYASATASVRGTPTLVSGFPTCIAPPASCSVGALAFTGGAWTGTGTTVDNATAHYSEVGVFQLQLEDQTYAAVDAVDGSSAALRTVPATATASVGRFVPASFDFTAPSTPQFRTFGATCAGARSFTYIGQPFWYVTLPSATVRALNAAGAVTTNYKGTLWKLAAAGIGETYSNNATGPALDTALIGTPTVTEIAGTGTGTYTAAAGGTLAYVRSTAFPPVAANSPFTANISVSVTASDASENAGNGTITSTTQTFNGGGTGIAFDSGAAMRFGVARIQNAYGSNKVNLPVPLEVQFWNGSAFARNTADHCTALATGTPPPNFSLGGYTGAVNGTNLPNANIVLGGSGRFTAGVGTLTINKPTAAVAGTALVTLDLTGEAKSWLKTRRTSATFIDDPAGRVGFGLFGAQPGNFIFRRENY